MYPPEWARVDATRLDLTQFSAAFGEAWARIERRFLKLECWQSYLEPEANRSQEAYGSGDIDAARRLLEKEAEADRPLYDNVRRRGIEFVRVRLASTPLSRYLEYEFLSYQIRVSMGENIEIVPEDDAGSADEHFDFLLFDRHTALVHDYGSGDVGRQTGGWLVRDVAVISRLERTVGELRQRSVSFSEYLATMGRR